jgi:hypothetical protein
MTTILICLISYNDEKDFDVVRRRDLNSGLEGGEGMRVLMLPRWRHLRREINYSTG